MIKDSSRLHNLPAVPSEIVGGLRISALNRAETSERMIDVAIRARGQHVPPAICCSANGQVLADVFFGRNGQQISAWLKDVYILNADGQPLVFASRLLGGKGLEERCATTDLFHDVAQIASKKDISFYLLGASPTENSTALERVKQLYPHLKIAGSRHGYFSSEDEEAAAIADINNSGTDILWIAMGFPRELQFSMRWRHALTNVGVVKTSGGLFNFLSGTNSRAPGWMQQAGLEWAYRLYLEPRRLFFRYATTNVMAAWLLLTKTHRNVTP